MSYEHNINWQQCLDNAAGQEELAREMLVAIIDELPMHRQDLISAYQEKNTQQLAFVAHKLNGMCCYSGLPRLKLAAQLLEEEVQNGNRQPLPELYTALLDNMQTVMDTFERDFAPQMT